MEAANQAPQQEAMTPQQAYANVISRQRDAALNRAAELEVHAAMLMQDNADLRAKVEALQSITGSSTAAPANRAQRRAQKKG